jgi:hypothetical protein
MLARVLKEGADGADESGILAQSLKLGGPAELPIVKLSPGWRNGHEVSPYSARSPSSQRNDQDNSAEGECHPSILQNSSNPGITPPPPLSC